MCKISRKSVEQFLVKLGLKILGAWHFLGFDHLQRPLAETFYAIP